MDDALLSPEREQRTLHPSVRIRCIVLEIDCGRRAIVLAGRVDRRGIAETALVLSKRARVEQRKVRAPASELPPQVIDGIGADQPFGEVEWLDQEEPVVVRGREGHVGAGIHRAGGRDVEHRHALDGMRVIEAQPMRDAPAAIVSDELELRESPALASARPGPAPSSASSTRCGAHHCQASMNRRTREGRCRPRCSVRRDGARRGARSRASADSRAAGEAAGRCRQRRNVSLRRKSRPFAGGTPGTTPQELRSRAQSTLVRDLPGSRTLVRREASPPASRRPRPKPPPR